ncbi:MAG TPA: PQQ-binding-like beta-propeller repeat protein [Blastocatellia bacterium]|jgi:outer membrane protein assembly factor BamB
MKQCFLWVRRAAVLMALTGLVSLSSVPASMKGSNWAGWRGPDGQGVSDEKNLPTEWSETKNVKWKTPIPGRGFSCPVIWGNRVFLTTAIEGDVIPGQKAIIHKIEGQEFKHPDWVGSDRQHTFKVLCLDSETGKVLWERTAYEGKVFDHRHRKGSYASPTAVTDGQYVYSYFGSEGIYCYDFKGNQVWKTSFGGVPTLGMGVGTSPVLYENLLIIQCDQDEGTTSFIAALDKKTGKEVWRQKRNVQVSWSTPVIARSGSRVELVTNGNEWIISYDPATGKEWWRCKGVDSNAIHTPLVGKDMVIVSAGFPAKRTFAIKLGGEGDITNTPNVMWKYEKGTAYVASPILYGDYLYLVTDKGILTCLDPNTGEVKYEGGRVPIPASFMASPVAYEGNILLPSEDGDTFVVKAGPKHEVLRTNSLGEPVYTSPSIAGGKIFIRGEKNLYCISK